MWGVAFVGLGVLPWANELLLGFMRLIIFELVSASGGSRVGGGLWAGARGPTLHKDNVLRVATVVTNVETSSRIYLAMMVSLRSLI